MKLQDVTIHRPTETTDGYGNTAQGAPYTDVPAKALRVSAVRSREITEGRQTLTTAAAGVFPAGTDIRETDELTAGGKRYRVVGVMPIPKATDPNRVSHVRADLEAAG